MQIVLRATERRLPTTVPAPVLVEWWRGRSDLREKILAAVLVEPLHAALARSAAPAKGRPPGGGAAPLTPRASARRLLSAPLELSPR
jgi:hypothetical protein